MKIKHENGQNCPSCREKLHLAHPEVLFWFVWLKGLHPDAHVSWSFRDEESQNEAFLKGLSKVQWPDSKHNYTDEKGNPCSLALDIFQIKEDGHAYFDVDWYTQIYHETLEKDWPMRWGGTFEKLKDYNHFELNDVKEKI